MKTLISLHPRVVTATLLKIVGSLLLAALICLYLQFGLNLENGLGFMPLFDINGEYNIPALYSASAIWFSAALLLFIHRLEKKVGTPKAYYWRHFAYLFIFLGVDELASIHEIFGRFAPMIWERFPALQISRKWIIPFSPVILAMAVYFFRFYILLSKENRMRFTIAGLVFLSGAVGIEILGEWYANQYDMPPVFRGYSAIVEEGCEMLGIVLFIRALLLHICQFSPAPNVAIDISFDTIPDQRKKSNRQLQPGLKTVSASSSAIAEEKGKE
ncbi:MAG: hypothetical protein EOO14_12185 [Chitinophagaceae bacterium]|nr:MAG: hypothetical protein EOO14_12185 [Chitinophagaceae bacterium]